MKVYVYAEACSNASGVELDYPELFIDEQEAMDYLETQKKAYLLDSRWKERKSAFRACSLVCEDGRSAQLSIFKREL